jgi:hypothetical protein
MDREGEDFWVLLEELGPGMVEAVALRKQHMTRQLAVEEFEQHLMAGDWDEHLWQAYFQRNEWIFGHNLVLVGGTTLKGWGGQRTDIIIYTQAKARFTVLVDLKRPDSELVGRKEYRNKVYPLGEDLTGGASQLQSYCRTWAIEGSRQEENAADLQESSIFTYEPRGILVIGNLKELDNQNKRATFELFRRNLHNPEIITYDELLERARFTVRVGNIE